MDIVSLAAELIAGHPVTGAYDADSAIARGQIHAVNIIRNRTSMTSREIMAEIVDAEYDALLDVEKTQVLALLSSDSVDPYGFAANVIKDTFGAGSATVANLAAARVETVSQVTVLGLGNVRVGDIQQARA